VLGLMVHSGSNIKLSHVPGKTLVPGVVTEAQPR